SQQFQGLDDAMQQLAKGGFRQLAESPLLGDSKFDLARGAVAAFDAQLAAMVQEGSREDAAAGAERPEEGARKASMATEEITALLPAYRDELDGLTASQKLAANGVESISAALAAADEALEESRKAAGETASQFITLGESLNDGKVSLGDWLKELEENARALRNFRIHAQEAAEKGLDEGLIASLQAAGPEGARRMRQLANATDEQIERANRAWRRGQEEVGKYTDEIGGVPSVVRTQIIIDGIQTALGNLARVRDAMSGLG